MDGVGSDTSYDEDSDNDERGEDGEPISRRKTVIVLAATNTPWDLDEAIRRRLEKRIYIPLPDEEGRCELFRINMRNVAMDPDIDFKELAMRSQGYSGDDLAIVCRDASMMGVRRLMERGRKDGLSKEQMQVLLKEQKDALHTAVTREDFLAALAKINKSVSDHDLSKYADWMKEFGSS